MLETEQLSLSWDAHQKSISGGLSHLQQRGEFVDMTLAADGHHVKVHQLVMSLVSPYIKELISSAQCPHPVIFLNILLGSGGSTVECIASANKMCAIIAHIQKACEGTMYHTPHYVSYWNTYTYTGEVLVPKCKLPDLIAAGKALHIRGLREMADKKTTDPITASNETTPKKCVTDILKEHREINKITKGKQEQPAPVPICKVFVDETNSSHEDMDIQDNSFEAIETNTDIDTSTLSTSKDYKFTKVTSEDLKNILLNPRVQYSVSIQGHLQAIYNRCIYHTTYYAKKNRTRSWRCINYNDLKCSAKIFTDENNKVVRRSSTHNHPFHDSKILKKLSKGVIYSHFQEAENIADGKKKERRDE